jgi:hypothetical protein
MSERNGDRARFQKDRRRKLGRRQRIRALATAMRTRTAAVQASAQLSEPRPGKAAPNPEH